ncbi:FecR domain-containing protein [Bordetella trematum]|uniref:FecR domain-containing protein n=1 Tax=Bordetella trematum TaxID=123899 RepID=UPI00398A486C
MPASTLSHSGGSPPMACGEPISDRVADEAAEWLTLLMDQQADEALRQRWQAWLASHPDHERAWRHVETVSLRLQSLQAGAGYQVLSPYAAPRQRSRRRLIGLAFLGLGAGGASIAVGRSQTWRVHTADYRAETGRQRLVRLDDGSLVRLNTASAIDVRFNAQQRSLRLLAGEIEVTTGPPEARPFFVETAQGRIQALGTRFSVRQREHDSSVAVLEHSVAITPCRDDQAYILHAGQQTSFQRKRVQPAQPLNAADTAWLRGQLVATDMRLADFLAELARYRPGLLRCHPDVAELRLSGVFPLEDTDRILATLPSVLPVQVHQRTRYWVSVEAVAEGA